MNIGAAGFSAEEVGDEGETAMATRYWVVQEVAATYSVLASLCSAKRFRKYVGVTNGVRHNPSPTTGVGVTEDHLLPRWLDRPDEMCSR